MPRGPLQFTHIHFSDLPDWNASDPRQALLAFQRSCTVMTAAPPETVVGAYAGSVADWRAVCDAAARADVNAARDFFEQWFAPLAVRTRAMRATGSSPAIMSRSCMRASPSMGVIRRRSMRCRRIW